MIGPLNTAGQGRTWANSLKTYTNFESVSFSRSRRKTALIDGPAHRRILHHRIRPTYLKKARVLQVINGATHLLNESLAPIWGDGHLKTFLDELPLVRLEGISAAIVFHGSDARSPKRHMEEFGESYFKMWDLELIESLELQTRIRRSLAIDSGLPTFVSTPDQLSDIPSASWLPVTIDKSSWQHDIRPFAESKIRVLHVPSRRNPPIKGTSIVDPLLSDLAREGVIEYINPSFVPHSKMPNLVKSVDVVIDQILSGFYGVAAVEAMAAGRLVIGNLGSQFRERIETDIPIVDASPMDLERVIRDLISDRAYYSRIAEDGPRYVRLYHDGLRASQALLPWLKSSAKSSTLHL